MRDGRRDSRSSRWRPRSLGDGQRCGRGLGRASGHGRASDARRRDRSWRCFAGRRCDGCRSRHGGCDGHGRACGQRLSVHARVSRGAPMHLGPVPLRNERHVRGEPRVLRRRVRRCAEQHDELRSLRKRLPRGAVLQRGDLLVDADVLSRVRRRARRALRRSGHLRVRRWRLRVSRRTSVQRGRVRLGLPERMPHGRSMHGPRVRVRNDGRHLPRRHRVPQRSMRRSQRVRSSVRRGDDLLQPRVRQSSYGRSQLRRVRSKLHSDPRRLLRSARPRQPSVHADLVLLARSIGGRGRGGSAIMRA